MSRIAAVTVKEKVKMYSPAVKRWNEVMQNGPVAGDVKGTLARILRQSAFVVEEAKEIQDGALADDVQEILDGYLDTRFVNDQIGVYLESLGVDIEGGWLEVCRSNNTKFSDDLEMLEDSVQFYFEQGVATEIVESPVAGTFLLKRVSDGKVMKPLCFEQPNLRKFIPKPLRGKR